MLNILTNEVINQVIRVLRPCFEQEQNYGESLETFRFIEHEDNYLKFIITQDSVSRDFGMRFPPGVWYPSDFINYFNSIIEPTEWKDIVSVTYDFSSRIFIFSVNSGTIVYDETDPGAAETVFNLVNPTTPEGELRSSEGFTTYQGDGDFALVRWKPSILDGNIPDTAQTSKIFIGPSDNWNRVHYPAVIIEVEGGTSKDFNIGDQDVKFLKDPSSGELVQTRFAGLWENVELQITVLARSSRIRNLLMDFVALLMVLIVRKELGRVGITITAPVRLGGKSSIQDAEIESEIVYSGTVSTTFVTEWEVDLYFRSVYGNLYGLTYLETTPAGLLGTEKVVVRLTSYNN